MANAIKHTLVPEHKKLTETVKNKILERYGATIKDLPQISKNDVAIAHLGAKPGDLIKIVRKSPTAGKSIYYRGVSNE